MDTRDERPSPTVEGSSNHQAPLISGNNKRAPTAPNNASPPGEGNQFGTFGGVFTPVVLTILGVIMFMRTGYVVGYAGLWWTLGILFIAKAITTLTTLSLSAIATNLDVRVGGVYFMISRVLGPDIGGSIGITLFIAQAVSIAFYTIGFTEAAFGILALVAGDDFIHTLELLKVAQIVSTVVVAGLFVLTFKGARCRLEGAVLCPRDSLDLCGGLCGRWVLTV